MIIYNNDKEEVFKQIASHIAEQLAIIISEQETATIAVPGGRSAAGIFEALCLENIEWEKVRVFMVDERMVKFEDDEGNLHDDLNYKILEEELVEQLVIEGKLNRKHIHPFKYEPEEDDLGLGAYEEELLGEKGKFDIVVLSAGEDGHIGALFPQHHSIKDDSRFFISMDDSPKPPPLRMSASRKLILGAQVAFVLFLGDGKREAYEKFNDESIAIEDCPARLLNYVPTCFVGTDIELE